MEDLSQPCIIYALGRCQIDYEVSSPWSDSLLGEGIAQADLDFMRTPASDDIVRGAGVSVMLRGVAGKDGVEKRFDWVFRNRIDYTNCSQTINGELVQGIDFMEGAKITQDLVAHGGALFQDHERTAESLLVFDPFAAADDTYGNANGDVTLDELGLTPLADITTPDRYIDAEENWDTLEDYVYLGSLRNIVSFGIDGTWDKCEEVSTFANDRVPH